MAAGQQAAMGKFLAFSRTQESSADAAAAGFLAKSGTNGEGLIDFRRIFRAHRAEEYIVERDDAGVAPRTTEQAIQTARTGFEYLRALRV